MTAATAKDIVGITATNTKVTTAAAVLLIHQRLQSRTTTIIIIIEGTYRRYLFLLVQMVLLKSRLCVVDERGRIKETGG